MGPEQSGTAGGTAPPDGKYAGVKNIPPVSGPAHASVASGRSTNEETFTLNLLESAGSREGPLRNPTALHWRRAGWRFSPHPAPSAVRIAVPPRGPRTLLRFQIRWVSETVPDRCRRGRSPAKDGGRVSGTPSPGRGP